MKDDFSRFLVWESAASDAFLVRRIYVKMVDDFKAGALLSRMVYYYLPARSGTPTKLRVIKDGEYWIAKSRSEWAHEISMTLREFDRALSVLTDGGIVEKSTYKFDGVPVLHVRIVTDKFMKLWEKQFSNIEKGHVEFVDGLEPDKEDVVIDDAAPTCSSCEAKNIVEEKYDQKGRCPYCLLLAAWQYYFPDKQQPRATTTSLRAKANSRWRSNHFRKNYIRALARASKSHTCITSSWFHFEFFVRNDTNYQKMLPDGFWMEWQDEEHSKNEQTKPMAGQM